MPHPSYAPVSPYPPTVQFKAFASILPFEGKRWEIFRDMERIANSVESEITTHLSATITISTPVAFTPQFGDKTARLTIVGNVLESTALRTDRTDAHFDHDNGLAEGQVGGPNMARTDPLAAVDARVKSLKALLESVSLNLQNHIYKMEYAGCVYGEGGRSFPL